MTRAIPIVIILLASACLLRAQVGGRSSPHDSRSATVLAASEAVNKVLLDSGALFAEGLAAYANKDPTIAAKKFNQSVEIFLYSTLNTQTDLKLFGCYN